MKYRTKPKILITNAVPADQLAPLDDVADVITGPGDGRLMPRTDVLDLAPDICGIINQAELSIDSELLNAGPGIKIIANVAAGFDNMDLEEMTKRGVWGTNTPDVFVDSTADCTIGLMITLLRKVHLADRYIRSGRWVADGFQPGTWEGIELRNKTLGIIGYGRIGRAVSKRAAAFGMRIIYHTKTPRGDDGYSELETLLSSADIVSLHCPLNNETKGLINREHIALMKPGSFLINLSRGQVVVEQDLVDALLDGRLGGAALDVFEREPRIHPALLTMNNVVLTPHIGGGTHESRRSARLLCAQNVAAVIRGRKPLTPVNKPLDMYQNT